MNSYNILFKVLIKNQRYIEKKTVENNINIVDTYTKNNYRFYIISNKDYVTLSKLDYKNVIIYIRPCGFQNLKNIILKNIEKVIVTLIIIIILFLSNNLIIKVNVNTNDINLKRKIEYALMDSGIKNYSFSKSYQRLEIIKNNIIKKYNEEIEWIELVKNGYTYNVYVIKRKINKNNIISNKCNYVANKSGTITKIFAKKGVLLVNENNYVHAGDILISGSIIYNEELKKEICAQGKIYGEVWYEVEVNYPLTKEYYVNSKKSLYNISFSILDHNFIFFKNKYNDKDYKFKINNNLFKISIYKNYKKIKKTNKITEEEGLKLAIKKAEENVLLKAGKKSRILSQNILKKYVNNGTIYTKVLIAVEEELGVVENY